LGHKKSPAGSAGLGASRASLPCATQLLTGGGECGHHANGLCPGHGQLTLDGDRAGRPVALKQPANEVLARIGNLLIARGAYREVARLFPEDKILPCQGKRVIEKSR
jgi:hypothetical protein